MAPPLHDIIPAALVLALGKPIESCDHTFDDNGSDATVSAHIKGEAGNPFFNDVAGLLIGSASGGAAGPRSHRVIEFGGRSRQAIGNLPHTELRTVPGLETLSVFHGFPQGTNFAVTPDDGVILQQLVARGLA